MGGYTPHPVLVIEHIHQFIKDFVILDLLGILRIVIEQVIKVDFLVFGVFFVNHGVCLIGVSGFGFVPVLIYQCISIYG